MMSKGLFFLGYQSTLNQFYITIFALFFEMHTELQYCKKKKNRLHYARTVKLVVHLRQIFLNFERFGDDMEI